MPSTPKLNEFHHRPALLEECLNALELRSGSIVVDGTVGGGGHAAAILERSAPDGRLIGLDVDAQAIRASERRLESFRDRVTLVQQSFRHLEEALARPPGPNLMAADHQQEPAASSAPVIASNFEHDEYLRFIQKTIDYFYAGAIFQACISQRLEAALNTLPYDLYCSTISWDGAY